MTGRHGVVFEGTVKSSFTFVIQISHLQKGSVVATPGPVKKQANSVLFKKYYECAAKSM